MAQYIVNVLSLSSMNILVALGFHISFRTQRFLNVSHAIAYVVAPYTVYVVSHYLGFLLMLPILSGLLVAGLTGGALEYGIYAPLRQLRSSGAILLMASLGVYVIAENIIHMLFGSEALSLYDGTVTVRTLIIGARVTSPQIISIVCAFILMTATGIFLYTSVGGRVYRAAASNEMLSLEHGIDVARIKELSSFFGAAIIGCAGIIAAYDTSVEPGTGLHALFLGVVISIIGRTLSGIIITALLINLIQTLITIYGGAEWRTPLAFVALLIFILLRPQTIFDSSD